jgi:polysaccharide chain length determinant protein (PEP-CTERM system associated)
VLPQKVYTPEVILEAAWRHRWVILLPFVLATAGIVAYSHSLPNLFKSETLILVVPQRIPETYVRATVTTRIEDRLRSIRQQILSRTRLEQVILEFDLYPEARKTQPMEEVVEMMRELIVVEPIRGDAFRIEFVARDSVTPAKVVTRLAGMFIEEDQRDRSLLAQDTNDFLESQLNDAKTRLLEHERKLEAFKLQHAGELPSQMQSNLQVIQTTQTQLQSLNESIIRDRDQVLQLERSLSDAQPIDPALAADAGVTNDRPAASTIADELDTARAALRALAAKRYKADHPDVIAQQRLVHQLEARLTAEPPADTTPVAAPVATAESGRRDRDRQQIQTRVERLNAQIAQKEREAQRLEQMIADYRERVEAIPTRETQMTELTRDYDTLKAMYTSLLAKKEDSNIAANLERKQVGEQFKILDPARPAEVPFSPNRLRMNFMGSVAGLMLGLTLAALLEYRDSSLRTTPDVVRLFSLPVLAVIPFMESPRERRARHLRTVLTTAACAAGVAMAVLVLGIKYGVLDWSL